MCVFLNLTKSERDKLYYYPHLIDKENKDLTDLAIK
jgi:hypothetical protein